MTDRMRGERDEREVRGGEPGVLAEPGADYGGTPELELPDRPPAERDAERTSDDFASPGRSG